MSVERSRSRRRVRIKTPSGRVIISHRSRNKGRAKCAGCSVRLHGVSHARGIAASKRAPSRPYGGVLCSRCSRNAIKGELNV